MLNEKVFFLNPDDLAEFQAARLVDPGRAVLLDGIGVDLEHYAFAPPQLRPVTFLLAARLLAEKGVREYAEAARQVRARHPDVRVLLAGAVDVNPSSLRREEIEGWVAEGVLQWTGHVADIRELMRQTSVFVLPSYYREGLPRSTQEAMAMGRPIITTDTSGCRQTVEPGRNGYLVPVRDPAALAAAMLRFVEQPQSIGPMGRESRRIAEQRFDVHKANAAILRAMGL
jgi:glycosyltransferase involved in cell wall biosynthesis